MNQWSFGLLALGMLGCNNKPISTGPDAALTVHEWGTFTSMVGSTGAVLSGLHHEEEALPAFVHSRSAVPTMMKGLETIPDGVTQKLETPVLYFYTKTAQPVTVTVGFPDGVVSQWFPKAAEFSPAVGAMGPRVAGGSMTWRGQLQPGMSGFPAVDPADIWAPSRTGMAVPIAVDDEREQFIFYRGLGSFNTPLHTEALANGTLTVTNDSDQPIQTMFLLRQHSAGGYIAELGGLEAHQSMPNILAPAAGKERNVDTFVADASNQIAAALVKSGLTVEESRAMVDTWSRSYFRTPGLRLLYIVPRVWTDKLLPITISPAPTDLVRTLVGRVEVLAPTDESELMSQVRQAAQTQVDPLTLIGNLGRFAEAKLRRATDLVGVDVGTSTYLQNAIAVAHANP